MDTLPYELLENIWSHLNPEDYLNMSLTSKSNNHFSKMFFKRYVNLNTVEQEKYYNNYNSNFKKILSNLKIDRKDTSFIRFKIYGNYFQANNYSYVNGIINIEILYHYDDYDYYEPWGSIQNNYIKYFKTMEYEYGKLLNSADCEKILF